MVARIWTTSVMVGLASGSHCRHSRARCAMICISSAGNLPCSVGSGSSVTTSLLSRSRDVAQMTRLSSALVDDDLWMGGRPVMSSSTTTPKLNTSDLSDALPTMAYSGAKYPNVPSIRAGELEQLVTPSFIRHLAMPRSVICTHTQESKPQHNM